MSEPRATDQDLLIDFLRGECEADQAQRVRRRLETDKSFKQDHDDVCRALGALRRLPEPSPRGDLVEATMARIRTARQTETILAQEEIKRQRAVGPTFSVREFVAAAAAAVLIAAVFIPSIWMARQRSLRNLCYSHVGQIGQGLATYANDHDGQFPTAAGSRSRWLPASDEPAVSNSTGLFRLVRSGRASPVLFQCPATGTGSFVVKEGMIDFPEPKYVSYSYQYTLNGHGVNRHDPSVAPVAEEMAILADTTPVFPDGTFRPDRLHATASDNHGGTGQNVLYVPGNVAWAREATVGVEGDNIYLADGIDNYSGIERPMGPTDSFLLPSSPEPGDED